MCKIHILRHTCGHFKHRKVSTCRGTFTTPQASHRPLCLSEPTLAVAVSEPCQDCYFKTFCDQWESRIEAARPRYPMRKPLVLNFDDACGSMDDDESWSDGAIDSMDWAGEAMTEETEAERQAIEQADREVANLQRQYGKEKWDLFQSYLSPSNAVWCLPMKPKKRVNKRTNGQSPLRKTLTPEDLGPLEEEVEEPRMMKRIGSDVSDSSVSSWDSIVSETEDDKWSNFMLPCW